MVSKVFEGVNYYLAEKNVQEPDEVSLVAIVINVFFFTQSW